ncbi:MAG: hypothetical protein DMD90_21590 [Candidatus Rokuibacteriota bacterium]|nr:MAG: hypothetical protein DMD90_21590 [Candidatus Rokubacteria bacterium]
MCEGERDRLTEPDGPAGHERMPPFLDASPSLCCDHECLIMERSGIRNWLKVRMITGFFVTVPAVATAWILWIFWSRIDDIFGPMYERAFGRPVPGLGFMTAVTVIFLMGALARNVVGRRVLGWADAVLERLPVFGRLYPSVKMLVDAFSPERRSGFKAVVLVQHPREGGWAFGFVTSEVVVEAPTGKQEMNTVFVPTNNLYLGDVILVPRADVLHTGLSVEEGIRVILSAGTVTPSRLPRF